MLIFLDSANHVELQNASSWVTVSGVTTNPILLARDGTDIGALLQTAGNCYEEPIPVSLPVLGESVSEMVKQAQSLASRYDRAVAKLPCTKEGLDATRQCVQLGIAVNATLVFSVSQGVLAAACGANYISPFIGPIDDGGYDGFKVLSALSEVFTVQGTGPQIIAAGIRSPLDVVRAFAVGAPIATVPYQVLDKMVTNPFADAGLRQYHEQAGRLSGYLEHILKERDTND